MHPVLCTNTHHDVTDLVNHGMVKSTKTWISWERNITFLQNKKILNLYLRWHILRSYGFLAEVTFNPLGHSPQVRVFTMIWFVVASFWDFLAYLLYFQMKPQLFIGIDIFRLSSSRHLKQLWGCAFGKKGFAQVAQVHTSLQMGLFSKVCNRS